MSLITEQIFEHVHTQNGNPLSLTNTWGLSKIRLDQRDMDIVINGILLKHYVSYKKLLTHKLEAK